MARMNSNLLETSRVPNEHRPAEAFGSGEKEGVYGTPLEDLAVAIYEVPRPRLALIAFDINGYETCGPAVWPDTGPNH